MSAIGGTAHHLANRTVEVFCRTEIKGQGITLCPQAGQMNVFNPEDRADMRSIKSRQQADNPLIRGVT